MEVIFTSILEFWYIMLVVFILGRFMYYPNQSKRQFLFTYLLLTAIISVLCMIISRVNFGIGFAWGCIYFDHRRISRVLFVQG